MKKTASLILLFLVSFTVSAQDNLKRIDHNAYDGWKSVKSPKISKKGNWVTYEIQPQMGDGYLYICNPSDNTIDSISRGYDAKFISGGDYVVFKKRAPFEVIRKLKLAKKKEDDFPKDSLGLFDLRSRKITGWFSNVKLVEALEGSSWFMILQHKVKSVPVPSKKKKKKKNQLPEKKSDGSHLDVLLPSWFISSVDNKNKKSAMKNQYHFTEVTEITSSENGNSFAFVRQFKTGKTDSSYVYFFSTENGSVRRIYDKKGFCKNLSFDESGKQLAFNTSNDTAKIKAWDLAYWKDGHSSCSIIAESSTEGMPEGWCVGEAGRIFFSENGKKIFFGTRPKPEKEIKDTLTDDEKYKLDVWSWSDIRLQPEQLKRLEQDKKRTWLAVYHLENSKMVQIADSKMDMIRLIQEGNIDLALGISDEKYEKEKSWTVPIGSDFFLIDLKTGERKLVLENHAFHTSLSESGKYLLYYSRKGDDWFVINLGDGKTLNITQNITEEFFEDDNGNPAEEDAYGVAGWSENDEFVYLYSRYDIWKINPANPSKAICLTKNFGRESKTVLRNIILDRKKMFVDDSYLLLHSFNEITKQAGYFKIDSKSGSALPIKLIESDHRYFFIGKAEEADRVLFSRSSFREYPDLRYSSLAFLDHKKISETNPQQKEYHWGTVELVRWRSNKGRELQGLVYKPDDFDSTKKYPMLVYFYEKYSDAIHNYYSPKPSASIINPTEYSGNNYIVFIPDILYDEGSPGEDAYDCIVSGTNYMVSLGYINKERMGLQGQSWGGYQTAWLITQTNIYRAAMAGAPVSNMTSAYGGIRWGSGLSRMFQYEKTQSRLGVTLWEDRERYIKNSPVFFADKVETPLLMMHNDKDGAVPWYQGIEYFVALRRLNKPVWMLNYNDDDHNLTRRANQKDLSIRMRQFFDHYLQDQPIPVWMKEGLPALDKGKKTGYDLSE